MKPRKRYSLILPLCLLVALSGCNGIKSENETLKPKTEESITCILDSQEDVNSQIYECSYNDSLVNEDKEDYSLYEDDFSALGKDIQKADDNESEDEDEDDSVILFDSGPFEWWWIVIIVGVIALLFFVGWLIFFIWDRKDKKKYKKKP